MDENIENIDTLKTRNEVYLRMLNSLKAEITDLQIRKAELEVANERLTGQLAALHAQAETRKGK